MLNNVFVISTKKANSFALCLEAAKYGEHVSLIYAGEKDDAVNAEKAYWLGSLDSTSFVTYILMRNMPPSHMRSSTRPARSSTWCTAMSLPAPRP